MDNLMIDTVNMKKVWFLENEKAVDQEKPGVRGSHHQDRFFPGQPWLDTDGKPIQAHGGSVYYENGVYYWYGENKEYTDGQNGIWHWGVRYYSSLDLYNWKDKGLLIPPLLEDPHSPLHPMCMMDRPHIIHNEKTGKYVCWLKIMEQDGRQTATILTAEQFRGPYTIIRTGLLPCGMSAGDFDLTVDEDGKAYYFFERVHMETICAELTEDYTDVTGVFSEHFAHPYPPYVREATAHFKRKGRHYLLTSGTTGYLPNPSEAAVAETPHGPYKVLGVLHPGDPSHTSFHSQISCVLKVQGKKDLFIACADRWVPDHMEYAYEEYAAAYESLFSIGGKEAEENCLHFGEDRKRNTSIANYVWLPIRFEGERPVIDWMDSWRWEDMEG